MVRKSKYAKFDEDFKRGGVALVVQTGKPVAQVARELGINDGTLATGWPRPVLSARAAVRW